MQATYNDVGWGSPGAVRAIDGARSSATQTDTVERPEPSYRQLSMKIASALHRAVYVLSKGRVGRTLRGGPVLLLTTTGRNTRRDRTWPLCYLESGDDVVVVASAAGARRHPGWYHNLTANPLVRVTVGGQSRTMVARTADGPDRARLWERMVRRYPVLARYQERARREFPVVVLRPVAVADSGMSRVPVTL